MAGRVTAPWAKSCGRPERRTAGIPAVGRYPARVVVALALVALLVDGRAAAQPQLSDGDLPVNVEANGITYHRDGDRVVAQGDVVIRRGETELRADEVELTRATNQAAARGSVSLCDPEGVLTAERFYFDLDDETGTIEGLRLESTRRQYTIAGDRARKGIGQSYHIENGRFTTCRCAEGAPSWSISGREVDVDIGGYGWLRGGTFNILDVPVLYVPRLVFPVRRERQTGLLTPRFGVSNKRGVQMLQPFFWAIDKSQDATAAFDVETNARLGVTSEYRYVFSRRSSGSLGVSYFNEFLREAEPTTNAGDRAPENRWSADASHRQLLPGNAVGFLDVSFVSDDLFLREINTQTFTHSQTVALRSLPFTNSRVGLLRSWDHFFLKGEAEYRQNLAQPDGTRESETLQRLPEVVFAGQEHIPWTPLLAEIDSSIVDFHRATGVSGLRYDLAPRLTLPLPLGRRFLGSLNASVRETAYTLFEDTPGPSAGQSPNSKGGTRELFQLGARVSTSLDRVYDWDWFGMEKLKNSIEPTVEYLYVPIVAQRDRPMFDATDRINQRSLFTYGLTTRFTAKFGPQAESNPIGWGAQRRDEEAGETREVARLSVFQSADVLRTISPITGASTTGSSDVAAGHFSDIDFAGRISPSRSLSARFTLNYNTGNTEVSAAHVGVYLEDPRRPHAKGPAADLENRSSVGIAYRFLRSNLLQELDADALIALTDWAGFRYATSYDLGRNRFLNNFYGIRLLSRCNCWVLDVGVADQTNPHDLAVRAQLSLVGLGSTPGGRRMLLVP